MFIDCFCFLFQSPNEFQQIQNLISGNCSSSVSSQNENAVICEYSQPSSVTEVVNQNEFTNLDESNFDSLCYLTELQRDCSELPYTNLTVKSLPRRISSYVLHLHCASIWKWLFVSNILVSYLNWFFWRVIDNVGRHQGVCYSFFSNSGQNLRIHLVLCWYSEIRWGLYIVNSFYWHLRYKGISAYLSA